MKRFFCIVVSCLCASWLVAQTHSFQVWNVLEASYDVTKKFSLDLTTEFRFQPHGVTFKQGSAELGAKYACTKNVFVGGSYEFADKYRTNGYFPVHTFAGTIGYKKKFDDFRITIQTKLNISENTYKKNAESEGLSWVNKNKIKCVYTGYKHLNPTLFIETYHPLETGCNYHVATAKYGASCAMEFRKNFEIEGGYMLRHEIDDKELISIITLSVTKNF